MSEAAPRKFTVERPETQSLNDVVQRTVSKCLLCKGQQSLQKCPAFRRLHLSRRLGTVKRLKYCVNCLAQSHFSKNCRSRERWNVWANITLCCIFAVKTEISPTPPTKGLFNGRTTTRARPEAKLMSVPASALIIQITTMWSRHPILLVPQL